MKLDTNTSNEMNHTDQDSNNISSLAFATSDNNNKGTLIVNVTTVNNELGKNKSSDFLVSMHANEPIPSMFKGNSNGTSVELSMGMYSVTISSIPNYNSYFSEDCYGGIMDVETKFCNITNTYSISNST